MTRAVFAARQKASQAITTLNRARVTVKNGPAISEVCQEHYCSVGLKRSESVLQRRLRLPEPSLVKGSSGFYLKTKEEENRAFSEQEENGLGARVLKESHEKRDLQDIGVAIIA